MSSASIPDDVPATDSEPTISLISTQQPFASPSPSTAHNMPVPVVKSQQLRVKAEEKAALGLGAEIPLAMRFPSSPSSPPLPFPSLVAPFPTVLRASFLCVIKWSVSTIPRWRGVDGQARWLSNL